MHLPEIGRWQARARCEASARRAPALPNCDVKLPCRPDLKRGPTGVPLTGLSKRAGFWADSTRIYRCSSVACKYRKSAGLISAFPPPQQGERHTIQHQGVFFSGLIDAMPMRFMSPTLIKPRTMSHPSSGTASLNWTVAAMKCSPPHCHVNAGGIRTVSNRPRSRWRGGAFQDSRQRTQPSVFMISAPRVLTRKSMNCWACGSASGASTTVTSRQIVR